MFNLSPNTILKFILLLSFFALSAAYFIEFALGHLPCALCKIQRIPYIAALVLISLFFLFNSPNKYILIILIVVFFLGTIVSLYHVGIEQGIFNESFLCKLQGKSDANSAAELLSQLKTINVSCKEVPITFMGFSLATFNALLSFTIFAILIKNFNKYEKNK